MSVMRMVASGDRIRLVHHDGLVSELKKHGKSVTKRASHVEPDDDGNWYADMSPVGGPMLSGFATRAEALEAEREWLFAHGY